jgi:hypothetical protein
MRGRRIVHLFEVDDLHLLVAYRSCLLSQSAAPGSYYEQHCPKKVLIGSLAPRAILFLRMFR